MQKLLSSIKNREKEVIDWSWIKNKFRAIYNFYEIDKLKKKINSKINTDQLISVKWNKILFGKTDISDEIDLPNDVKIETDSIIWNPKVTYKNEWEDITIIFPNKRHPRKWDWILFLHEIAHAKYVKEFENKKNEKIGALVREELESKNRKVNDQSLNKLSQDKDFLLKKWLLNQKLDSEEEIRAWKEAKKMKEEIKKKKRIDMCWWFVDNNELDIFIEACLLSQKWIWYNPEITNRLNMEYYLHAIEEDLFSTLNYPSNWAKDKKNWW